MLEGAAWNHPLDPVGWRAALPAAVGLAADSAAMCTWSAAIVGVDGVGRMVGRSVTRVGPLWCLPMTRAEKAEKIRKLLDATYPTTPIPLDHHNPYTLLVSVLLSAQCTDIRVNQVTPALFALAGTPEQMSQTTVAKIKAIIRPCGLSPQKSKAIHQLSKILIEQHAGRVPDNFADLEALPGVGHKTASVVMSQAFGHPAFPVDTHIHRLGARWGLSNGHSVEKTERDLKRLFPVESWGRVHLQMIFFGREFCPARSHDLSRCPICSWAATKKRIREEAKKLPKKPRKKLPQSAERAQAKP